MRPTPIINELGTAVMRYTLPVPKCLRLAGTNGLERRRRGLLIENSRRVPTMSTVGATC